MRPAMLDASSLGLDVATELEARLVEQLEMVSASLSLFINPTHDVFGEVQDIKTRAATLMGLAVDMTVRLEKLHEAKPPGLAILPLVKEFEKEHILPLLEDSALSTEAGLQLLGEFETALERLKTSALEAWADMEARLQSTLRLVSKCRDFYDHLGAAQTAGEIAHVGQQRALNETWNALALELADIEEDIA